MAEIDRVSPPPERFDLRSEIGFGSPYALPHDDLGAAVIVASYTHDCWRESLSRPGFLNGPSSYLLALSKPLAAALRTKPDALGSIYVSRADGDGRLNL